MKLTNDNLFSRGRIYEKVENDYEMVLPLFFPPPMSYSLHGAITSSIILSRQDTHEWFLNNFVNVSFVRNYSESNGDHVFQVYPLQHTRSGKNAASMVLQDIVLDSDLIEIKPESLIANMISWIKQGYYVSAVVNVLKLPGTKYYRKDSTGILLHGITCFGFNLRNRTFKIMDFDNREILSFIDIDSKILNDAYFFDESAGYKYRVSLRKHKDKISYSFDYHVFKNQLKDYIGSSDSGIKDSFILEHENDLIWGIKTYDYVIPYTEFCIENHGCIDIRLYCAMAEHKRLMLDRLIFSSNNIIKAKSFSLEKYRKVAEMADGLKVYILKNEKAIIESGDIKEIANRVRKIKREEKAFLHQLYRLCRRL